jgi:hemoglobin-like flavoprotein
VVAQVMIDSLAHIAGPAWRPEHENAWSGALGVIADAMLGGAREAEASHAV